VLDRTRQPALAASWRAERETMSPDGDADRARRFRDGHGVAGRPGGRCPRAKIIMMIRSSCSSKIKPPARDAGAPRGWLRRSEDRKIFGDGRGFISKREPRSRSVLVRSNRSPGRLRGLPARRTCYITFRANRPALHSRLTVA
jgi:hypothetical protein